jgi:hypothetical protein
MNMPGFSAEASAYRSPVPYVSGSSALGSTSVQPAAAIYVGGLFYCYGEVTSGGVSCYDSGGGGGPIDPGCRPGCGTCRRVPGGGRVKTCVTRDCDTIDRPC